MGLKRNDHLNVCIVLISFILMIHHSSLMTSAAFFTTRSTINSRKTLTRESLISSIGSIKSSSSKEEGKKESLNTCEEPTDNVSATRRSTLAKVASLVIPTISAVELLLHAKISLAMDENDEVKKRTIIVTGCNSGIGLDAVMRFAQNHKVILACRTLEKAENAVRQVQTSLSSAGTSVNDLDLIPLECNLASLKSISTFAQGVAGLLGDTGKVDVLALNAGLARNVASKDVLRTEEGFELTIGTNHLGHFYLANLLLPLMDKKSGRIVVTASGVHDPESPGGAQGSKASLGDLSGLVEQGPFFEMVDGSKFDADKAYKDSKLCNVLFTRELQRKINQKGYEIKANCFNPGLIVGTGLFRDQNQILTKVFDIAATNLLKVGENTHWGGGCLEYLCLDKGVGEVMGGQYYTSDPGSSKYGDAAYGNQFCVAQPSKEARDDKKAKDLWRLSAQLLGMSPDMN